ncbi:MAG: YfhO family protein, partial [Anaerolineae bacterium]|nr:YfhO family protein [Anaerolineae bacterium]
FLTASTEAGILLALAIGMLLVRPTPFKDSMRLARRWQWLALLFIAVDLGRAASTLIPLTSPQIFQQSITTADVIKAQPGDFRIYVDEDFDYNTKFNRFFRFDRFGPGTVEHWQQLKETLAPNLGVYADLPSANNDDPLTVGRWKSLIDALDAAPPDQQRRLLGLMNVGYLLTGPHQVGPSSIYEQGEIVIQSIPDPLPRAYFVSAAGVVENETAALARLMAADFDSRREVVIISEGLPGEAGDDSEPKIDNDIFSSKVSVSQEGPNQVRLTLEAPAPGFVVLTDTFYPGWQALHNGQPAPILPANLAFRAVAVEAGAHDIVFTYRPWSFTLGLWVSGFTWLAVVATAVIQKIRE